MQEKILVIGSNGQIGTELVEELRKSYGASNVIASDIKKPENNEDGPFEVLDVLDSKALSDIVNKYQVTQIYLLAALLSATAEQHVHYAWKLNMDGLVNVLELAREKRIAKIYWPSSIAVFGPHTPRQNTPQYTIMDPSTVYGFSKLAGERWCEYYHLRYGVDVRGLRYPGLIGYKAAPGGGTTDYAVHIFHEAIKTREYTSFLDKGTYLPMMYMPDAIRATISLMEAPSEKVKIRSSYNLAGISFSPEELAAEIKKHIPEFVCHYKPDSRQQIANSWPASIDDSAATHDWGWKAKYDLPAMTEDMLKNIRLQIGT
jgi:nucleoside-diphosphate-sugar epimerase